MSTEILKDQIGFDTVSMAGKTSPRELGALMAHCDFCISVDTGAIHVAREVELPTVILCNAAQPRWLWLPPPELKHFELIRRDHLSCSFAGSTRVLPGNVWMRLVSMMF